MQLGKFDGVRKESTWIALLKVCYWSVAGDNVSDKWFLMLGNVTRDPFQLVQMLSQPLTPLPRPRLPFWHSPLTSGYCSSCPGSASVRRRSLRRRTCSRSTRGRPRWGTPSTGTVLATRDRPSSRPAAEMATQKLWVSQHGDYPKLIWV